MAAFVHDLHVIARHGHGRRAVLDRQNAEADRIAGDGPAGFGLPPMVDDRNAENLLRPGDRVRIGAFAGQEQGAQAFADIVFLQIFGVGVFLAHGAEGGRRGEQSATMLCSSIMRQKAPGSGVPIGLPS